MKKTFTVNISGTVYQIDEDAYRVLNDYLESIKHHFASTEGRDEIIADFESRISEMLQERVGNGKSVVTIEDIEKVIEVLGVPEDFEGDEEGQKSSKFSSSQDSKRLFRDPDNKMIAGVCSGLGAYFHTDPLWFRLAFVITMFPMLGTSTLIYFVLWLVIPEASTTAEKLKMRGEKVNIKNIEHSIKEEINDLKDKFKDFTKEAKRTVKKKSVEHQSEVDQIGYFLLRIMSVFVKIVLIFTGIILSLVGFSLILAFILFFFDFGSSMVVIDSEMVTISLSTLFDLFFGISGDNLIMKFGLTLFFGIPIFMILFAGIKLIFGIERTRVVNIVALYVWLVGIIICAAFSYKYVKDFSHEGYHHETYKIPYDSNNIFYLDVKDDAAFKNVWEYENHLVIDEDRMIITTEENDPFYGIPQLQIKEYQGSLIMLEVHYKSKGKNQHRADERAKEIIYNISTNDSSIIFDPYFKIKPDEVWRIQEIEMVLNVPENTYIKTSRDMHWIIDDYHHRKYSLSDKLLQMQDYELIEINKVDDQLDENISKEIEKE